MEELLQRLGAIFRRASPPEPDTFAEAIARALERLENESPRFRPPDDKGKPGGLVFLDPGLPTIVVPDLHARMDFFLAVLGYEAEEGCRTIDLLEADRIQVVCLGDGVHAEGRAVRRWQAALEEFLEEYREHRNMDDEMRESLGVMEMVMEIKRHYPARFHFLKGNHENITNESGGGNLPFRKFALEGAMVLSYMRQFYGPIILGQYARFEKELPLLVVGPGFLLSHAEPARFYPPQRVIGFRGDSEVVEGLTWTDNDAAEPGSVESMLRCYLGEEVADKALYLGGHRPAVGSYKLRAGGKYVQIHDPDAFVIAHLPSGRPIEPGRDIVRLDTRSILAV
jgi:hypothetical protein